MSDDTRSNDPAPRPPAPAAAPARARGSPCAGGRATRPRAGRARPARPRPRRPGRGRVRGFTLIEALAALLLVVIVLPVVMRGVALATGVAAAARHRTEAASLAGSKLAELVATGRWQSGYLSGRFDVEDATGDGTAYAWDAEVGEWAAAADVRQLDLRVSWTARGVEQRVTLTTLVYPAPSGSAAGGSGGAGTGGPAAAGGRP